MTLTQNIAEILIKDAEEMELYTLLQLSPGFIEGYRHALGLMKRNSMFNAQKIVAHMEAEHIDLTPYPSVD